MKKNLAILTVLMLMMFGTKSFAAGVGYIDYGKVQDNYAFAKAAVKEVDAKALELQQYMVDKEKQYKSLSTPVEKQNFETATAQEYKGKEDALMKLKAQKEEQVYNKIQAAAKAVLVEQKLDTIVDFRVIFVGGVDVSDAVIAKLKTMP